MAGKGKSEGAASFGYTLSFFNRSPELKGLLDRAVKGDYSQARFIAEFQNTKWFRTHSESSRKYEALKSGDPAGFKEKTAGLRANIAQMAGQLGAQIGPNDLSKMADDALRLGWNEAQVKAALGGYIKVNQHDNYTGAAGVAEGQIREMAAEYGVSVSPVLTKRWINQIALGLDDPAAVQVRIQELAASKYPALRERLLGGETVRNIADPYIQSYGKILEQDPAAIKIEDPLVQRALQSNDAKTGKPTTMSVFDFENTLRQDARWRTTKNAQDQMTSTASAILKTFGLMG